MRTNIDIDDELLAAAMRTSGLPTKRAAVEQGLKLLIQLKGQVKALDSTAGIGWDGDLQAMREWPSRRRSES